VQLGRLVGGRLTAERVEVQPDGRPSRGGPPEQVALPSSGFVQVRPPDDLTGWVPRMVFVQARRSERDDPSPPPAARPSARRRRDD
jgi:hypothetical protein